MPCPAGRGPPPGANRDVGVGPPRDTAVSLQIARDARWMPESAALTGYEGSAAAVSTARRVTYEVARTPTWRHMSSTGHAEQRGAGPRQTCLPKGTRRRLISTQWRSGSTRSSCSIVFSGVAARTYPHRFVTRWTWMSTEIRGRPQATPSARWEHFGPTPGRDVSTGDGGHDVDRLDAFLRRSEIY